MKRGSEASMINRAAGFNTKPVKNLTWQGSLIDNIPSPC